MFTGMLGARCAQLGKFSLGSKKPCVAVIDVALAAVVAATPFRGRLIATLQLATVFVAAYLSRAIAKFFQRAVQASARVRRFWVREMLAQVVSSGLRRREVTKISHTMGVVFAERRRAMSLARDGQAWAIGVFLQARIAILQLLAMLTIQSQRTRLIRRLRVAQAAVFARLLRQLAVRATAFAGAAALRIRVIARRRVTPISAVASAAALRVFQVLMAAQVVVVGAAHRLRAKVMQAWGTARALRQRAFARAALTSIHVRILIIKNIEAFVLAAAERFLLKARSALWTARERASAWGSKGRSTTWIAKSQRRED